MTEIKSNQIKSNQIKSNQIKSNQIKSNQIKSNQADYVASQPFCQPLLKTFSCFCEKVFSVVRNEVA